MAFFNLWSSERLSFSLSIIAVVSAAITTFHQFHKSTEINCIVHLVEHFPSATDQYRHDTLSFSCSFLNSGSTPVGLIDSRIFLANDAGLEKQSSLIGDAPEKNSVQQKRGSGQSGYFPPQSVVPLHFKFIADSLQLVELVSRSPRLDRDSNLVQLNAGVWLRMIDPFGNESQTIVDVGNISYWKNSCQMAVASVRDELIPISEFEPIDEE